MTLNDLERQNTNTIWVSWIGFFLAISGCNTSLYHSQSGATPL